MAKHNHRAGDGSYLLYGIDGIPFKRACNECRKEVDPTGKLETHEERFPSPWRHYQYLNIWESAF